MTTPSALELCAAAISTFMDLVHTGDVVQLFIHVSMSPDFKLSTLTIRDYPMDHGILCL